MQISGRHYWKNIFRRYLGTNEMYIPMFWGSGTVNKEFLKQAVISLGILLNMLVAAITEK